MLKNTSTEIRDAVLKYIKTEIRIFKFKSSNLKGMFKSRITHGQVNDLIKRKEAQMSDLKSAMKKLTK